MSREQVQLNTISYFDDKDLHPRALLYALSLIVKVLTKKANLTKIEKQEIIESFWHLAGDIEGNDPNTQAVPPPVLSKTARPLMEGFLNDVLNPADLDQVTKTHRR